MKTDRLPTQFVENASKKAKIPPLIPLHPGPAGTFPASRELPAGAKTVKLKDNFGYPADFFPNVIYDTQDGMDLHLQILIPKSAPEGRLKKWPLIVYIQGSAWHKQDLYAHLPHLLRMVQRGYASAVVEYRPSDTAPFPAQIQDAKTAVRYLRSHAGDYQIAEDKIALWGDSSGAHTALTAGFTGDGRLDNGRYPEYSCSVNCIVDWYGPTEFKVMNCYPCRKDHTGPDSPEGFLIGRKHVLEHPELAGQASPAQYLSQDRPTPPVLIMHGNADQVVPFNQSCRLYNKMKALGKQAEFIRLEGADHGIGGFNCDEVLDLVEDFLVRMMG